MLWTTLWASTAFAGVTYFPGENEHATLLFEDQWPCDGDLDFNDAVLRYTTLTESVGANDTRFVLNLTVHALGASLHSGAALTLPVDPSDVVAATLQVGSVDGTTWGTPTAVTVEDSAGDAVFRLASDLRATCGDAPGFLNTEHGAPTVPCAPLVLEVTFAPGVSLPADVPDLWIFRTDTPGHEVHQSRYPGSAASLPALPNSCDDASTGSRFYVDTAGIPFALLIGEGTGAGPGDPLADWPTERTAVDVAWPTITTFASSGGTAAQAFYKDPANDAELVWSGSGGAPAALHTRYPYGRVSTRPGLTCAEVLDADPGPDGLYWLDPTGDTPADAFRTWCDMAGGGRTLVAHRNTGTALLDDPAAQGLLGQPTFGAPTPGQTAWFKLPSAQIDALQGRSARWRFTGQAAGRAVTMTARGFRYDDLDQFHTGRGLSGCGEDLSSPAAFEPDVGAVPSPSCWAYPTSNGSFYDFHPASNSPQGQGVTIWLDGHAGTYGRSAADPGLTCLDIFQTEVGPSGLYWIAPAGSPVQVWCDMDDGRTLVAVKGSATSDITTSAAVGTAGWPNVDSNVAVFAAHHKLPTATIDALQALSSSWYVFGEVSGRWVQLSSTATTALGLTTNSYAWLPNVNTGRGMGGCGTDKWSPGTFYPETGSVPNPSCWAYPTSANFYDFKGNPSGYNGQGIHVWLR